MHQQPILAVGVGKSSFRNTSSSGGFDNGSFRNAGREAGRLALDGSGSASVEESLMISSRAFVFSDSLIF